jgi:hypothetical protein
MLFPQCPVEATRSGVVGAARQHRPHIASIELGLHLGLVQHPPNIDP